MEQEVSEEREGSYRSQTYWDRLDIEQTNTLKPSETSRMSFSELAEIDLPGESEITFTEMSISEIQTEFG